MGSRFLEESHYGTLFKRNDIALSKLMRRLITSNDGVIFVSVDWPSLSGMIGGVVYDHPMTGERMATEAFWWVDPENRGHGLKLLRRLTAWAKVNGATKMQMIAPDERVARVYRGLGFTKLEEHFQKDIPA